MIEYIPILIFVFSSIAVFWILFNKKLNRKVILIFGVGCLMFLLFYIHFYYPIISSLITSFGLIACITLVIIYATKKSWKQLKIITIILGFLLIKSFLIPNEMFANSHEETLKSFRTELEKKNFKKMSYLSKMKREKIDSYIEKQISGFKKRNKLDSVERVNSPYRLFSQKQLEIINWKMLKTLNESKLISFINTKVNSDFNYIKIYLAKEINDSLITLSGITSNDSQQFKFYFNYNSKLKKFFLVETKYCSENQGDFFYFNDEDSFLFALTCLPNCSKKLKSKILFWHESKLQTYYQNEEKIYTWLSDDMEKEIRSDFHFILDNKAYSPYMIDVSNGIYNPTLKPNFYYDVAD